MPFCVQGATDKKRLGYKLLATKKSWDQCTLTELRLPIFQCSGEQPKLKIKSGSTVQVTQWDFPVSWVQFLDQKNAPVPGYLVNYWLNRMIIRGQLSRVHDTCLEPEVRSWTNVDIQGHVFERLITADTDKIGWIGNKCMHAPAISCIVVVVVVVDVIVVWIPWETDILRTKCMWIITLMHLISKTL